MRFIDTLGTAGAEFERTQTVRRELVRRVIALDPAIDEALGESSQLRYHSPVLQNALDGLVTALAGWRTAAVLLARLPEPSARARGGRQCWLRYRSNFASRLRKRRVGAAGSPVRHACSKPAMRQ